MNRKIDRGIRRCVNKAPNRGQGFAQGLTEVLTPVRGEQNSSRRVREVSWRWRVIGRRLQQRIDHRVAGYQDIVRRDILASQMTRRGFGGCAMQSRRQRDGAPMKLFGKRRGKISGTQSGFDVHERNAAIKCRKRGSEHRCRIALRNDKCRLELVEDRVQLAGYRQQNGNDICAFRVIGNGMVGEQPKLVQRLFKQIVLLTGRDDEWIRPTGLNSAGGSPAPF